MAAVRAGLVILRLGQGSAALFALFAPRSFFDDFPVAGAHWVSSLPPYNEHLIRDVGGLYLALGLLFAWAAVTLARALVVPVCVAWAGFSLLHGVFHALHLDGFSTVDAIVELASLAAVLVLPLLAIWVARRDVTDLAV